MEEDRKVECIYVPPLAILLYLPNFRRSDGFCLAFGITYRISYRKAIVGAFWRFFREARKRGVHIMKKKVVER